MNILGKRPDQQDKKESEKNIVPSMVLNEPNEISFEKALLISALAHPLIVALLWSIIKLAIFLLALLGINLALFDKPPQKVRDIEFVLVNQPEQKPINPKTRFRAERNTRAGGKHDPTKPVVAPEPAAPKSAPQRASAPARQSRPQRQVEPRKSASRSQQQEQTPAPPRPMPLQGMPRPSIPRPNAFSIPIPKAKRPGTAAPTGGPVTSGPIGDSSPSSSPAPVMSGGYGTGSSRGRYNSGYSMGGGSVGNPGPGNPNGRPGIDAIREPDFGPYMAELQRRIKRNWTPPRENTSRKVVLLFKIARDGRLKSVQLVNSSGNAESDKAAIAAVHLSAPFRPLPPEFREDDIDIQFTFDYNVFNVGGIRRY